MAYILAVHIPIAGISLLPVLFNWPLILLPIHVVFLELIIDPSCSVVFEAEEGEPNIMTRPPRNLKEPMFSAKNLGISAIQGAVILGVLLIIFSLSYFSGRPENEARGLAYGTLVVANLGLILTNRSWSGTIFHTLKVRNKALIWVVIGIGVFLVVIFFVPVMRNLFKFGNLGIGDLLICVFGGFLSITWFEIWKYVRIKRNEQPT